MSGVGWVVWVGLDRGSDPSVSVRQVGLIRFHRDDGHDARVDPEPDGTHLSRGSPSQATRYGRLEASCGRSERGFADYGPIDAVTCPDCAAMLAAELLRKDRDE